MLTTGTHLPGMQLGVASVAPGQGRIVAYIQASRARFLKQAQEEEVGGGSRSGKLRRSSFPFKVRRSCNMREIVTEKSCTFVILYSLPLFMHYTGHSNFFHLNVFPPIDIISLQLLVITLIKEVTHFAKFCLDLSKISGTVLNVPRMLLPVSLVLLSGTIVVSTI